jgi:plasmid stabilization system protein ParE
VKSYRVLILPSAERDIGQAYSWLAERNGEAAVRWYNRLVKVVSSLETLPERCPLAPEGRFFDREIRQILHGQKQHKYRILFDIDEDLVRILHVRHGARLVLGEPAPEHNE